MLSFAETVFADLTAAARRWAALLLAAAAVVWAGPAAAAQVGVVQVPRLNLRPTPDLTGAPVAVLSRGDTVRIVGRRPDWVEVEIGRHRGFIRDRDRYIRIQDPPEGGAPAAVSARIAETREQAADIAERLKNSRSEAGAYAAKEADVLSSLDGIDRTVARMRRQAGETREEMRALDERMDGIRRRIEGLHKDIARRRDTAARRLVAYYKLGWVGRLQLLASAESMQALFFRERALSVILDADAKLLQALTDDRDRLAVENRRLAEAKQEQAALASDYETQLQTFAAEKSKREALLGEIRQKKDLELATISGLERAARELDQALAALSADLERPRPAAAAPRKADPPALQPFDRLKGLLPFPVEGNIVNDFGEYRDTRHNVVNFRSGVDIRADFGEPVHAVSAGKVLYADWFKGFGNMLILDHGDHYYTVYAHLEETFKRKGDPVEAGEVIATVGDTGSLVGPKLYFEVRHHGKPMDPAGWIKKG